MKEKLKYNFLHIILIHILNLITAFYFVTVKVVTIFVIPSVQQGRRKAILSGGTKLKGTFFQKKGFTELRSLKICPQNYSTKNHAHKGVFLT